MTNVSKVAVVLIGFVLGLVFWKIPNRKTSSYFTSYYVSGVSNSFFVGNRIFVASTLNVETINRMKGLIEEEMTNSTAVIISIQKLP